jgi:hypothetical protein
VIEVTAYDVAGNSASASITVFILDTIAPKVNVISPAESALVTGSVAIDAAATDVGGSDIAQVVFAVDGATVATDTTAPYSAVWNAADVAAGEHTITVTAYDAAGNSAVATRSVTVTASAPASTPAATPAPTPPTVLSRTLGTATALSGPTSVWRGRTLRLTGTVSPGGPGKVTISMTRKVGRTWRSAGHVHVNVVSGRYRYSPKPRYKGSWRFVSSYSGGVSALDTYTSSTSRTKTVRVR